MSCWARTDGATRRMAPKPIKIAFIRSVDLKFMADLLKVFFVLLRYARLRGKPTAKARRENWLLWKIL